jgi:hypothetical protein
VDALYKQAGDCVLEHNFCFLCGDLLWHGQVLQLVKKRERSMGVTRGSRHNEAHDQLTTDANLGIAGESGKSEGNGGATGPNLGEPAVVSMLQPGSSATAEERFPKAQEGSLNETSPPCQPLNLKVIYLLDGCNTHPHTNHIFLQGLVRMFIRGWRALAERHLLRYSWLNLTFRQRRPPRLSTGLK